MLFVVGFAVGLATPFFAMWFYGHRNDYDTPLKRGPDGWKFS